MPQTLAMVLLLLLRSASLEHRREGGAPRRPCTTTRCARGHWRGTHTSSILVLASLAKESTAPPLPLVSPSSTPRSHRQELVGAAKRVQTWHLIAPDSSVLRWPFLASHAGSAWQLRTQELRTQE